MIYPSGRYNLNFDICAIFLSAFLLLYLLIAKNLRVRRIRAFLWADICLLLSTIGELAMDIARNDNGINCSLSQAEFATFVAHVAHNSIPFLLVLYFLSLTGFWHGVKFHHLIGFSIPEAVLVAAHLVGPVRHKIYYYYGLCEYVRGPLYILYYIVVLFYVACAIGILIVFHSTIQKRSRIYVIILCAGYLTGFAVGLINPFLRMTNFFQTLVLLCSFFLLENEGSVIDAVTGVYNTEGLVRDTYPLFNAHYQSYILSIKLQHFNYYRLMVGMGAMTRVLHQIGLWMLGIACEERTFYRVGSGEFAVLLFNADMQEAKQIAEQIRERFMRPWHYAADGSDLTIPVQIWVSSIPDRISTEEQVLAFSEAAFNDELPQDQIFVADEMKQEQRMMQVDVAIRRAIANNGFQVYYQPIYDTRTGRIRSSEALVRMTDKDLGPVSPEEFIKVAEQTGTISRIGTIVFDKVCRFLHEEKPEQYGMEFVEVNLSPIQCMDSHLAGQFRAMLRQYQVRADQIVLEITESAIIHNEGKVNQVIRDLKNLGFRFALDDFGTGQSNYSYLRQFPFTIIKIDKSFLWAADKDEMDRIVLHNMLQLVQDLKLQAVVEGVEDQNQRDGLTRDGVDYLQGYYYSKPVPRRNFIQYIEHFNQTGQED